MNKLCEKCQETLVDGLCPTCRPERKLERLVPPSEQTLDKEGEREEETL